MSEQNPSGPVDRDVGHGVEWDVLAEYSRTDGRREWVTFGTWLLPGDSVVQVNVAELDRLRAELAEALTALPQAVRAERERCARLCENADKSTHPADLADAIRKPNAALCGHREGETR